MMDGPSKYGALRREDTLSQTFKAVRNAFSDRPLFSALQQGHFTRWVSYGEFFDEATWLGAGLISKYKLQEGDFVGICGHNTIEWFLAEYACLLFGLVSVGLPIGHDDQLIDLCKSFSIKVLLISKAATVDRDLIETPVVDLSNESKQFCDLKVLGHESILSIPPSLSDDRLFTIILTSGTTGLPKGVKYTRSMWNADMVQYPADRLRGVSYLPLANIVDRHHVAVTMFNGGEIVIVSPVHSVFDSLPLISPTILFSTPVICAHLASLLPDDADADPAAIVGGALRTVVCGAGHVPDDTADALRRRLRVALVNPYGTTDVGNIAVDGRLLPSVAARLLPVPELGYAGDAGPFPRRGELLVRTPAGFAGYARCDPAAAAAAVTPDGFFATGDLVELGPAREVRVLGRRRGGVKLPCGEWVLPEALEAALLADAALAARFDNAFAEARPDSDAVAVALSPGPVAAGPLAAAGPAALLEAANAALERAGLRRVAAVVVLWPSPSRPPPPSPQLTPIRRASNYASRPLPLLLLEKERERQKQRERERESR